ncbi:hypothetical protein FRB94_009169 [Tulasnella sp. JGI-2019a]|nr:hypothetical protein FRB94_009169 [Tulasnella sp. JGI-2019a]
MWSPLLPHSTFATFRMKRYRVAILTVSDKASNDASYDRSGPAIRELFSADGRDVKFDIIKTGIVPDNEDAISQWVKSTTESGTCDWILTTGGTGFGTRDRTPEAISGLIDRPAPGLVHLLISTAIQHTPLAALSRPVAGMMGSTLIVTLPGSPKAVKENLAALFLVVDHALDLITGGNGQAVHESLGVVERMLTAASPLDLKPNQNDIFDDKNAPVHIRHDPNQPIKPAAAPNASAEVHRHRDPPSHHHHDHHRDHHSIPSPHLSHDPTAPVTSRHRISPYPIISFDEAMGIILRRCKTLGIENRKVDRTLPGHVLAEDVYAPQNIPGTQTTNVDGYALHSDQGPATYDVTTPANHSLSQRLPIDTIMRVNTGAPIPYGTNAVIMVEDTKLISTTKNERGEDVEEKSVETLTRVKAGENIRNPGSDVMKGEKVGDMGELITTSGGEMGTLAFVGRKEVKVFRKPIVAILSTGNEITDISAPAPEDDSTAEEEWSGIYDTNRPSLQAALEGLGYEVIDLGIVPDTVDAHVRALKDGLERADLLLTTGGSSMGAKDLLKPVVERQLGGTVHFGRVSIKPGKPTTFATIPVSSINDNGSQNDLGSASAVLQPLSPAVSMSSSQSSQLSGLNKPMFALPGNPASALVTFWIFVVPALRRMGGYPKERCNLPRARVLLNEDLPLDPRNEFHRVFIRCSSEGLTAFSTGGQRSSRVASLAGANGLVVLPKKEKGKTALAKGTFAEAVVIGELHM